MKLKQRAFSLIELMVVIAIVGILASIAVPNYQSYVLRAKLTELISAASAAQLAVGTYLQESGSADCTAMPIVVKGGNFAYPRSKMVASVRIDGICTVTVTGVDGQWSDYPTPIITAAADIQQAGISWTCSSSAGTTFAPTSCPEYITPEESDTGTGQ